MNFKPLRVLLISLKYLGWLLAIVIIVIIIRIFLIEFYYVPSTSMAATLYNGDEIIVSKSSYGALLPVSPNEIPIVSGLLYIKPIRKWLGDIHWEYRRAPGWKKPLRGDIMVFKVHNSRELLIKRCVAGPGDTLKIVSDTIFINNIAQKFTGTVKLNYRWQTFDEDYSDTTLQKIIIRRDNLIRIDTNGAVLALPIADAQRLSAFKGTKTLSLLPDTSTNSFHEFFPHIQRLRWNSSYYGPLVVPQKGASVFLDSLSLPFYRKIIEDYENKQIEASNDGIYINGKKTQHYTFCKNYYFMMGDNRHCSYDSRFQGFVPENYIIGRAKYILFSIEKDSWLKKGVRWGRTLKSIR
ncbi:MAG: signal peptidase I [Bacteroidales bacterium]|nr:signal peptidase I [Bacteroidales bacterium]